MKIFAVLSLSLAVASISPPALARDLTPEIVNRCKAATALVLVGDEDRGTAFHVGQGLFVSNWHLVDDANAMTKVLLILDPGETTQREVKATILRKSEAHDLALFRISESRLPPALPIGMITSLVETASITAFGYPFGKDLAVGKDAYPSVTVSAGRITALRKEAGVLKQIQVDAPVSPGNSGGPVVDNSGQVIGVIKEGILGTAHSFAIPVSNLRQFLYGTTMVFSAPALPKAQAGKPDTLTVDVPAGVATETPSMSMTLSAHSADMRTLKLTDGGNGHFTVTAPLVPGAESGLIEATVRNGGAMYSVFVRDKDIKVGAKTMKLSAIREIVQGSTPSVTSVSGQTTAGKVTGLDMLERPSNDSVGIIDLSDAPRIQLKTADIKVQSVRFEITLKSAGKTVMQHAGTIDQDGVHSEVLVTPQVADKQGAEPTPAATRAEFLIDGVKFATTSQQETFKAAFNRPDGGATRGFFKGLVLVTVKGYGISYNDASYNDAFYLFTGDFKPPRNGHDGGFYQLTFGTSTIQARDLGANAKRFILGGVPPYSPTHEYVFVLDTRTSSPRSLHFGVSDGGFDENRGAFEITVIQLAPMK